MTAIPFVYFSLFSLILYVKRKRVDIAVTIAAIYAVSGFFSILVDAFNLRYADSVHYRISVTATIAYCFLLTLCLLPFAINSHLSITKFKPVRNVKMLKALAWFAAIWFVVTAALSWQNMMNVLTGNMEEYRHMMYQGEAQESWMLALPEPVRFVVAVVNSFFGCKWALLFLAFFSRYVQKLPHKYFILFMAASLSGPMNGIIGADRSATAYWIMSLLAMYLLFRPLMRKKDKRWFISLAVVVVGFLAYYLAAMTVARFGEREYGHDLTGSQGGLIAYFGQSFINFCLYFDTYTPPFTHLGIIFPFFYKYILGIPTGGVVIQQMMTQLTHFETGVFYTYIGQIIVGAGRSVAIAFCVIYSIASFFVSSKIRHHWNASAAQIYLYFALASVIFLGIFGHYYTSGTTTFGLIAMYLMLRLMK